ncbi:TIGR00266 family protein [Methanocella sp. MCL-LM]|uniref:TIGR00266 family protein n=1 Tax=Methanocella sp. MCL-LM TaxID=3412035 RepID=UPI003C71E60E
MKHEILYRPVYSLLQVELDAGEAISAESGAMVTMTPNIEIQTSAKGGVLSSLKRSILGGESFFQNTFTCRQGRGVITFGPAYMGDVEHIPLTGEWFVQSGSYLCSTPGLGIDTKFQGLKGVFSGENLFFLRIYGQGELFISSFGAIHPIDLQPGEEVKVDTGNLVAFQQGITYGVEKVGGIKSTMLSGEGLVLRLRGPGRIYVQTRSPRSFVGWLWPMLPKPQSQ